MPNKIKVMGNSNDVISYNLNDKIINFPKLIITKKEIFKCIEETQIMDDLLEVEGTSNINDKKNKLSSIDFLNLNFSKNFEESINSNLEFISKSFLNFELKNYSFSQFQTNLKYTILIRNQNFTITYFELEKGELLTNIKKILSKYYSATTKLKSVNKLDEFQVEIFESFEVSKQIVLKKENNNLILKSCFGFSKNEIIDYTINDEVYFSIQENFNLFDSSQNNALIKENGKIVLKDIQIQGKILDNKELVKINEITKDFNDVIIEIQITKKNEVKLSYSNFASNFSTIGSNEGFVIFKSDKNFDKISITSIREVLEDSVNPKYLLIRSETEFIELLNNLKILTNVCGVIFNINFYHQIFEEIGKNLNIDIIFYFKKISKTLEASINFEDFKINLSSCENPFESIITNKKEENSPKDNWLNHLNSIDLDNIDESQKKDNYNENIEDTKNLTESIISSEKSSFKKQENSSNMSFSNSFENSNKKMGAIDFLVQNALNHSEEATKKKENVEEEILVEEPKKEENIIFEEPSKEAEKKEEEQSFNLFEEESIFSEENKKEEVESSIIEENKIDLNITQENINDASIEKLFEKNPEEKNDSSKSSMDKYVDIVSIKIYTNPSIKSHYYFVDKTSINNIKHHYYEALFLTNNPIREKHNVKYLFVGVDESILEDGDSIIINSFDDFFKYHNLKDRKINYFVNLTKVDDSSKEVFLKNSIERFNQINVLLKSNDIKHIDSYYSNIKGIYIQDLNSQSEYDKLKHEILTIEKRKLYELLQKSNT